MTLDDDKAACIKARIKQMQSQQPNRTFRDC
jgi:hypothetical protein